MMTKSPSEPEPTSLADYLQHASAAFAARASTWPKCTTCDEPADPANGPRCDACRKGAERRRVIDGVIARANIPARYDARFDTPEIAARVRDPRALALVRQWSGADRLVLFGESGAGKSTAAGALLRHCIARDETIVRALWVDAVELAAARRRTSFGREPALEREAIDAQIIVLDDVGQEAARHGDRLVGAEAVAHVIFERHKHRRPVIFTTWADGPKLAELYGGGVARRIRLDGAFVIEMTRGTR